MKMRHKMKKNSGRRTRSNTVFSRLCVFGLVLCLMTSMIPLTAAAANTPARVDASEVILNGIWNDYDLPLDTYVYCPVYLSSNGFLDIVVQTYFDSNHYVYLLDSDMETVDYDSVFGSGAASPENVEYQYFLTAGWYYVRVESWNGVSGLFRIKGTFTPAETTEIEPNNTFEQAMTLVPNGDSVRGFLSTLGTADFWSDPLPEGTQDFYDYYVFQVDGGTWSIMISPLESMDVEFYAALYDSSRNILEEEYMLDETTVLEEELAPGTYYLKIESSNRASGRYEAAIYSGSADDYDGGFPDFDYDYEEDDAWYDYDEDDDWEDYDESDNRDDYDEDYAWYDIDEDYDDSDDDPDVLDYELRYGTDYGAEERYEDEYNEELANEINDRVYDAIPDLTDPEQLWIFVLDYYNGSYYMLFHFPGMEPYTWMESKEFCESIGGRLATIESPEEQEHLADMVKAREVNAWLGGYQTFGIWKWVYGSPADLNYWHSEEPNGSGDFMQMYSDGTWDDTYNHNYTVEAFICEWD